MIYTLGISSFYHDSAACLLKDAEIVAAAQEERFTRVKHDPSFPVESINYCCREAGIEFSEINSVGYYEIPSLKLDRMLKTFEHYSPFGSLAFHHAISKWIESKGEVSKIISSMFPGAKTHFNEHHESHAMSAFFASPFQKSAILTIDGVGEWATSSISVGIGNQINVLKELQFPHSLGLLYSAFTSFTGFRVNSGEYKVMGLAPYGEPKYVQMILDELIDLKEDGSIRLNMDYFSFPFSSRMTNEKFADLFGGPSRLAESELTQREMDLARSVQIVVEKVVQSMASHARDITGSCNLCLAGGVALNCVSNGKLLKSGIFDEIWVQPASGDAGGALGAAYGAYFNDNSRKRIVSSNDSMQGSFLGPQFDDSEISTFLESNLVNHQYFEESDVYGKVAAIIAEGNVVGWFQGRMEYGPRALGNRSILGDPRSQQMQEVMNLKIKYRESFRPFAPAVLAHKQSEWFDFDSESPYMLMVGDVLKKHQIDVDSDDGLFGIEKLKIPRSSIPAITHVDYSARVQSVDEERNPRFFKLISEFDAITGVPILINTSFNVRGEPPVCSIEDAYRCFMRTEMDFLVLGNFVLDKKEMEISDVDQSWRKEFTLD
jgi:carbamoyltransferase